ncbi:TPA: tryptophan--tRNA ligase [Candidatus Gracilibacteria bacterium]|nr:tryptophan--tRNA ligase [Candidatus Gracilibacteria bacterium]HIQ57099.1 tryptophan--tRNA ligase [Candidatus Gracilibacteria bacterium]
MSTKSVLTGLQPSGALHLGNYFGSIVPNLELAEKHDKSIIFIADLHALNSIQDKKLLQEYVLDLATSLLACGLHPDKILMFKQSDVSAHSELSWILSTLTPMGLLERSHAYKDKKAKGQDATAGLFGYPILMAADILLYSPDFVPVGKDQKQHVEITRDLANKFNHIYGGTVLRSPEPVISEEVGVVPGIDGEKMSKSYNNTIPLFGTPKEIKKRVMQIVTDSKGVEEKKDPETCNIFALAKLYLSESELADLAKKYETGTIGYGDAKKLLFSAIEKYMTPMWTKYNELKQNPEYVLEVLEKASKTANIIANRQLEKVKKRVGLI